MVDQEKGQDNNKDNKMHERNREKSWRTISTDKYIIAGIITGLIFFLGLTLGLIFEDARYGLIQQINQEQEIKYQSLQLQYLFLGAYNNENSCAILAATLQETVTDLSDSLSDVIAYEEENKGTESQKIAVQRRYLQDNLRYWLLAKESKKKCNMNVLPVLYFYKKDCESCPQQGTILSYFKDLLEDKLLVFPINMNLADQEPMVKIIQSQFNVTEFPTIVVDNLKYEGIVDKQKMEEIICSSLKEIPQCTK